MQNSLLFTIVIILFVSFSLPSFSSDEKHIQSAANSLFEEYYNGGGNDILLAPIDNYMDAFNLFNFWDVLRVWRMRGDAEYKGPKKWDNQNVTIKIPAELLPNLKEFDAFLNDISHYTELSFTVETYKNDIDFSNLSSLDDKITIALLNDDYFFHGSKKSFLKTATRNFFINYQFLTLQCSFLGLRCIPGGAMLSYNESIYPALAYLKAFTLKRYLHAIMTDQNLSGATFFDGQNIEFSICETPKAILSVSTNMQENLVRGCILKGIGLKAPLHYQTRKHLNPEAMLTDENIQKNNFDQKIINLHTLEKLALRKLYSQD